MLIVKKDFVQQYSGSMLSFIAGSVVTQPSLERALLQGGAPVELVEDETDLVTCPHCRKIFTVAQAVEAEQPKARRKG